MEEAIPKTLRSTRISSDLNPDIKRKPFKGNKDGPSQLDRILDRPCQIHGTEDIPATHTNRNC